MAWHNGHGVWHIGRTTRGIVVAEAWHNGRIRQAQNMELMAQLPIVTTHTNREQKSLKVY